MAERVQAPDLTAYKGNCHCGAFRFSIKIPEITTVIECNCSICFKKGYKWLYPSNGNFTVEKGEGSLQDYEFGSREMVHKFCPTCGTGIMRQRHNRTDIAVNARALQDVDLWSMKVCKYDRAAHKPSYSPTAFTGPEPPAEIENGKLYTGSCHCGAVTLALKNSGPLIQRVPPTEPADGVIGECDCSICARMGRILTYRPPAQISIHLDHGINLSSYSFGSKQWEHQFCPVCGVAVAVDDVVENMTAVNLRCLERGEWKDIETYKHRGSMEGPAYIAPE
ncbi:hypothetical protein N431DRAFT_373259 [Stipitochalara longipes BDJ]|nr:hypothetical protein N431DRAFT_373259 [Stipitochalara longipes BDJ]